MNPNILIRISRRREQRIPVVTPCPRTGLFPIRRIVPSIWNSDRDMRSERAGGIPTTSLLAALLDPVEQFGRPFHHRHAAGQHKVGLRQGVQSLARMIVVRLFGGPFVMPGQLPIFARRHHETLNHTPRLDVPIGAAESRARDLSVSWAAPAPGRIPNSSLPDRRCVALRARAAAHQFQTV